MIIKEMLLNFTYNNEGNVVNFTNDNEGNVVKLYI